MKDFLHKKCLRQLTYLTNIDVIKHIYIVPIIYICLRTKFKIENKREKIKKIIPATFEIIDFCLLNVKPI